jgi:hypothetical protein
MNYLIDLLGKNKIETWNYLIKYWYKDIIEFLALQCLIDITNKYKKTNIPNCKIDRKEILNLMQNQCNRKNIFIDKLSSLVPNIENYPILSNDIIYLPKNLKIEFFPKCNQNNFNNTHLTLSENRLEEENNTKRNNESNNEELRSISLRGKYFDIEIRYSISEHLDQSIFNLSDFLIRSESKDYFFNPLNMDDATIRNLSKSSVVVFQLEFDANINILDRLFRIHFSNTLKNELKWLDEMMNSFERFFNINIGQVPIVSIGKVPTR